MSSPLSAYGRVTVGGDGGLLDARMARASTISGGGLRGAECFVTYLQKLKSMGTISRKEHLGGCATPRL